MILVIEARSLEHNAAFEKTLYRIYEVESATEMTLPSWKLRLPHITKEWLADFDNLLKRLHELHTQMCHFDTVSTFYIKWAVFLLKSVDLLEELRAEVGLAQMSKKDARILRERIQFTLSRCEYTAAKTKEMLARVKGQINVVGLATFQITTRYLGTLTLHYPLPWTRLSVSSHKRIAKSILLLQSTRTSLQPWPLATARP